MKGLDRFLVETFVWKYTYRQSPEESNIIEYNCIRIPPNGEWTCLSVSTHGPVFVSSRPLSTSKRDWVDAHVYGNPLLVRWFGTYRRDG